VFGLTSCSVRFYTGRIRRITEAEKTNTHTGSVTDKRAPQPFNSSLASKHEEKKMGKRKTPKKPRRIKRVVSPKPVTKGSRGIRK